MDTMTDPAAIDALIPDDSLQARFTALLDQHRGIVLKIAHGYCRHPEDRHDLVQDISIQAWRAVGRFDPARSRFSTWLYRVALNVAISHVRSATLHERHHAGLDDEALAALPDPAADTGQADRLRTLRAVIDRLGPLDRALMLLYLDERSHREIAEVLGIGESNVATRLHRLRQRIAAQFADAPGGTDTPTPTRRTR